MEGKSDSIYIKNYFANIENDKVVKLTEIQIEDRLIQIFDYFTCTPQTIDPNSQPDEKVEPVEKAPSIKPKKLVEKRPKSVHPNEAHEEYRLRDTKNLVKNIFRLFQSWVEENTPA